MMFTYRPYIVYNLTIILPKRHGIWSPMRMRVSIFKKYVVVFFQILFRKENWGTIDNMFFFIISIYLRFDGGK